MGDFGDDANGVGSGSSYVFRRTGASWAQEAKLLPSDGAAGDQFVVSVSISGDYAVVGASGDDSGSAYVFKRAGTSWAQEAKILPSGGAASAFFGVSVSISGDSAIVGARNDGDNGIYPGSAYVFKRSVTSWTHEARILPSDGFSVVRFGNSLSISCCYAVLGATLD